MPPARGSGRRARSRSVLAAALALISSGLAGARAGEASSSPAAASISTAAPARVRVLVLPHLAYGIFYIAQELGLFAAQGLEAEFVRLEKSSGALPLMLKGELDVMPMAPSPALFHAISAGERVRIVSGLSTNIPGDGCVPSGLVARTGVEIAPGTRDLRVAANRANFGGYILERMLEASGLDPKEQRFADLQGSAELAAFLEGRIDAAVMSEPRLRVALDAGAVRLVLPARDVLPYLQPSIVAFGPRLIADRELGQRFANAYFAAVAIYLEGHTARNVDILARAMDLERDVVDRACWWPMSADGKVEFEPLQAYQRWEAAQGKLDREVHPHEYWDGGFADSAMESLARGRR